MITQSAVRGRSAIGSPCYRTLTSALSHGQSPEGFPDSKAVSVEVSEWLVVDAGKLHDQLAGRGDRFQGALDRVRLPHSPIKRACAVGSSIAMPAVQCGLNCVGMPNQLTHSSRIAAGSSAGHRTLRGKGLIG